jgi:O-Antigen ligase
MATQAARRFTLPPSWVPVLTVVGTAAVLGLLAAGLASGGTKMVFVAGGATVIGLGLLLVRERSLLVMVLMALMLQFVLHKSFGPIDDTVTGGAISVYVDTVDAFVVLLYVLWLFEGTLVADLKAAARSKLVLLPLAAIAVSVFSLLNAVSVQDGFAEMFRELWLYALFVYVAARVRTRREVAWIVGALFLLAAVQCAVVIAQWKFGGHLGLSLLGEDEALYTRVTDSATILRPSGTAIHPNILAAAMGPIGLLALSLALNLRPLRIRLACLLACAAAIFPLVLSQTRAAILGAAVGALVLIAAALWTRRLQWRVVFFTLLAAAGPVWYFWPQIGAKIWDNLLTSHFSLEVDSRFQLNWLALDMIRAHPFIGVGLNNFMAVFENYNPYGVLYPGFPVHNLFLLVFAETGVIGFLALVVTFVALFVQAVRLALVRDSFLSALGAGLVAALLFFVVEEQLSFSLRTDIPASVFWLLAGLVPAGLAIARRSSAGVAT